MSVAEGRRTLAIPGPTTVPDSVLNAMHRPAIDIYAGELLGVTETCRSGLQKVFGTTGRPYIYVSNGHGAWEAALTNVLSRGDKVLVLESGRFARGWGEMAEVMGIEVEVLPGDWRRAVDPAAVEARLKQADAEAFKAILVVQVDTASGVVNDIPAIRRAMDAAGSKALFLVDAIASLATMPFEMDAWKIDVAVTGSQKGLMMTPGLGLLAAGPSAIDAHAHADLRTHYWDWTAREGPVHYQKYCGTPPEHLLFGLARSFEMLFDEGMENVFQRHRILAGAVHAAVDIWASGQALAFNITEPDER
ncbi:MAG: aminotransferase class V-fold PLP-dependent enzyme, partial [Pseudomonadota bacterium]